MFKALLEKNSNFYQKYMRSFVARSSISSVELEENTEDFKTALAINCHFEAYDYLLDNFTDEDKIAIYDLPKIIEILTNGEYDQFRKKPIQVIGSNCERTKPFLIPSELMALFKDYEALSTEIENPYLLESIFHIRFLKVHPFGDGNGRIGRLLTCFHLMQKGIAPICIPRDKKDIYCAYIENNDYDNLAKMFEKLSKLELSIMENIWEKYNNNDLTRKRDLK